MWPQFIKLEFNIIKNALNFNVFLRGMKQWYKERGSTLTKKKIYFDKDLQQYIFNMALSCQ